MLRTQVISDFQGMDRLKSRWDFLSSEVHGATIFQSFLWNRMAVEMFADRESPRIIAAESDSGVVILPAVKRQSGGDLSLTGEALFDYRDMLSSGDEACEEAAFACAAAFGAPMNVHALRGDQPCTRWSEAEVRSFCHAPAVLVSQKTQDEFLAAHSRAATRLRRITRAGIGFRQYSGNNDRLVQQIYRLKGRESHPEPSLFADPLRREFMHRTCNADADRCDVFTYEEGSKLVAALVTFRTETWRHFYTIYHDPQYARLSPGYVLIFEVTARTLGEGLNCDYMTGEQDYKLRLATTKIPLFHATLTVDAMRTFKHIAA